MMLPRQYATRLVVLATLFVATALLGFFNELLFHSVVELFSIFFAFGVFLIAWNARHWLDSDYFIFVGIGFAFIGGIDTLHLLAYNGMGFFAADTNLPTLLWIAARYLQSITFLAAALLIGRRLHAPTIVAAYALLTLLLLGAIFTNRFPVANIPGTGPAPFTIVSEYIICLIFAGALALLFRKRDSLDDTRLKLLMLATGVMLAAGLACTLDRKVTDFCPPAGHLLNLLAFYLVYLTLVETGLERSFQALSQNLEQSAAALRASERRFRRALAHAPISITSQDRNLRFTWAHNQGTLYPDQVIGKTDADVFAPEDAAHLTALKKKILENGGEWNEQLWLTGNGQRVFVDLFLESLRNRNGEITGVGMTAVDLTKMKLTEDALRESNERIRHILESISDAFYALDDNWQFQYVNQKALDLWHMPAGELLQKNIWDVFPAGVQTESYLQMHRAMETRTQCEYESYSAFLDRWLHIHLYPTAQGLSVFFQDITERKRTEQALRESEARYRDLVELSPVAILINQNDRISFANPAALAVCGARSPAELVGKSPFEIFHPDYHDLMRERIQLLKAGLPVPLVENKIVRLDGVIRDVEVVGSLFTTRSGPAIQIIVRDINERKETERALRSSEERFRAIVEQAAEGISVVDENGDIIVWNRVLEKITGIPAETVLHQSIWDVQYALLPDEQHTLERYDELRAELNNYLKTGLSPWTNQPYERVYTGEQGSCLIEGRIFPIRVDNGYMLASISQDITERRQAEEQVRQLSRAVEASPVSILITDPHGSIEYVNPKFTEVTGYTRDEVLGKNPSILKSGETGAATYAKLWQTILSGQEWHGELHNKRKDGTLYWESVSISPLVNAGQVTHFVAVKEDITARKQAEAQLFYLSTSDALTGLYNRAYFSGEMDRLEHGRAYPVSLIIADVDNMKPVNDTLGHAAGDELLRRVARVLQSAFRTSDIVARIGGDEFAVILTDTDPMAATLALERVYVALDEYSAAHPDFPISLSLGVATVQEGPLETVFQLADQQMYVAKRARKKNPG